MSKVLFVAGDPGGSRALLPVIAYCQAQGQPFALIDHGTLPEEAPPGWQRISLDGQPDRRLFASNNIGALVFGSSVKDSIPLMVARAAKAEAVPVIHILDNWTSYRMRLEMDGRPRLVPDAYTVIDELAFEEALREGLNKNLLHITGQPGLANLLQVYEDFQVRQSSVAGEKKHITFISEPAVADQGDSPDHPAYRGYTELTVLELLCRNLQPFANKVELRLIPHPREDIGKAEQSWQRFRGQLQGKIVHGKSGREEVLAADGVVGMASILLYEAWLFGKPVLSLQPGLRTEALRMMQRRPGVLFVDREDQAGDAIITLVERTLAAEGGKPRKEMMQHASAPATIYNLIRSFLEKSL